MAEPFYITTAIAYPNGKPHIGHAYEAIAADAIARFHRMQGATCGWSPAPTSTASRWPRRRARRAMDTLEFATEMSNYFREMCARLNVAYDAFCRTTEDRHKAASVALWKAMEAAGDLYLDRYEGWYSVRDEAFYDEKRADRGRGGRKALAAGHAGRMDGRGKLVLPPVEIPRLADRTQRDARLPRARKPPQRSAALPQGQ